MSYPKPRTYVYVDSFNLYYGCLKGTPYRWLDISKMCQFLLPQHNVLHIKLFTAKVTARPHDPDQPTRQQTYFRALETLANFTIIYGHFLSHEVSMPQSPITNPPSYVRVMKTEEKGSDVNLATHLLYDAFRNLYDTAVIISNDSDLLEPIKITRAALNKEIGILNPFQRASKQLVSHSDFIKQIRQGVLKVSQFATTLTDANGKFTKPTGW